MAKKTAALNKTVHERSGKAFQYRSGKKTVRSIIRETTTGKMLTKSAEPVSIIDSPSTIDLNSILKGFKFEELKHASQQSGLDLKDVLSITGMSERTYERRRKEGRLTTDESDRVVRMMRIYKMAHEIFNDKIATCKWLKEPALAFNGMTPLEMMKTETGGRQVENLLGALAHGVFY